MIVLKLFDDFVNLLRKSSKKNDYQCCLIYSEKAKIFFRTNIVENILFSKYLTLNKINFNKYSLCDFYVKILETSLIEDYMLYSVFLDDLSCNYIEAEKIFLKACKTSKKIIFFFTSGVPYSYVNLRNYIDKVGIICDSRFTSTKLNNNNICSDINFINIFKGKVNLNKIDCKNFYDILTIEASLYFLRLMPSINWKLVNDYLKKINIIFENNGLNKEYYLYNLYINIFEKMFYLNNLFIL